MVALQGPIVRFAGSPPNLTLLEAPRFGFPPCYPCKRSQRDDDVESASNAQQVASLVRGAEVDAGAHKVASTGFEPSGNPIHPYCFERRRAVPRVLYRRTYEPTDGDRGDQSECRSWIRAPVRAGG